MSASQTLPSAKRTRRTYVTLVRYSLTVFSSAGHLVSESESEKVVLELKSLTLSMRRFIERSPHRSKSTATTSIAEISADVVASPFKTNVLAPATVRPARHTPPRRGP